MSQTPNDFGAETARFQAFKDQGDDLPPAWQMKASKSKLGLFAAGVVIIAVVCAVFGMLLAH